MSHFDCTEISVLTWCVFKSTWLLKFSFLLFSVKYMNKEHMPLTDLLHLNDFKKWYYVGSFNSNDILVFYQWRPTSTYVINFSKRIYAIGSIYSTSMEKVDEEITKTFVFIQDIWYQGKILDNECSYTKNVLIEEILNRLMSSIAFHLLPWTFYMVNPNWIYKWCT